MLQILHDDPEWCVLDKPAGLVCHPTKGDLTTSLVGRLRLHFGADAGCRLVHRLDRETSGLVVVARSREAARDLGRLFESREVRKTYLAIVHGFPSEDRFTIDAPIGRALDSPVAIQDAVRPDGAAASTELEVLRRFGVDGERFALVRLVPRTGRKHQLRIHLAHAGHAIVGDKIYGGDPRRYLRFIAGALTESDRSALLLENQALHAWKLEFSWRGRGWAFASPPDPAFRGFVRTGGVEWRCDEDLAAFGL